MRALADKLSEEHSASLICSTLGLPRSTRYHDATLAGGSRRLEDEALKEEIHRVYLENKKVYGSRRIRLALREEKRHHSKRRIARLMGELGIKGRSRGRKKPSLTNSKHKNCLAPNSPPKPWATRLNRIPLAVRFIIATAGRIYLNT